MSFLVSPRFDLAFLIGPCLAATAIALALPAGLELSPGGYLALVLGVDVAHVWGSLYRIYLQPGEVRRRPALYLGTPVVVLAACAALAATPWFWRVLAYVAVYHFVRQALGIGMIYRHRAGLPPRGRAAALERGAYYAVTLWPIVWWHAHLPGAFAWFVAGDFVPIVPGWAVWPAGAAAAVVVALHLRERVREGPSWGRDLWLAATAAVWIGGIVIARSDAAFTLTNVVAHGVPYLALVWLVGHRRWQRADGPFVPLAFTAHGAALFLVPLLWLAFVEEGLWDALVWHDHPMFFGDWPALPAVGVALATALLSVPQVTHYVLDGFIWKTSTNPGLRGDLLG